VEKCHAEQATACTILNVHHHFDFNQAFVFFNSTKNFFKLSL